MIKYNLNTINDWNFGDDNIIKVYRNGAVVFYKFDSEQGGYKVCFAVVEDITQYSDREFEDVYDKATEKWYKLNNLNQYEEYGVYGSGRTSCEGSASRLPQGYTEVEYIRQNSNYDAYINTGVIIFDNTTNTYTITTKLTSEFHSNLGCATIISCERVNSPYDGLGYRYKCSSTVNQLEFFGGNPNYTSSVVDNGDGTRTVTFQSSGNSSFTTDVPLSYFASFSSTTYGTNSTYRYSDATIYSASIVKNGITVRDFVPAKRDSDSVYGLYDLITDTFYTSPNGNNFSGGDPITPDCVTTYNGKLTIDDGYEYEWNGSSWANLGEVSGSSKSSGFTSSDIGESGTTSGFSDGDYVVISYKNNNSSTTPSCMMSYKNDGTYDRVNNFSGHTGSNTLTPNTIIDAAVWKFEGTATADTYYIKNVENGLYWGYQDTSTSRSFYLVDDLQKAPILIDDYDGYIGLIEKKYLATSYFGGYGLNQLYGYTYQLGWLNSGTGSEANFYTTDGNALYALYKVNGGTTEYPKYYSEKSEPLDNLTFNTLEEAQAYAEANCVYDGMHATIDGDRYYFDSTDENGWVKILEYYKFEDVTPNAASGWTISGSSTYNPDSSYYDDFDLETTSTNNSYKIAKVTIYGYDHFTYYLRSYHSYSSSYGYIYATNVDEVSTPPSTMSYGSSSAITNTYNWNKSPKSAVNLSNYRRVTYNNLDKTVEHTFYVYFYGRTYRSYVGNATILIPKEQTNENWEQVTFSASSNVASAQKNLYIDNNNSTSGGTQNWYYRWIVGLPSGSHTSSTNYSNYSYCPNVTSSTFTSVAGEQRQVNFTYDNVSSKTLSFRLTDGSNVLTPTNTVYYNMTYYNSCGVSNSSSNVTFPRSLNVIVGGRFRFANSSNRHYIYGYSPNISLNTDYYVDNYQSTFDITYTKLSDEAVTITYTTYDPSDVETPAFKTDITYPYSGGTTSSTTLTSYDVPYTYPYKVSQTIDKFSADAQSYTAGQAARTINFVLYPNNREFATVADMEAYAYAWEGMKATVGDTKYKYENGEWVENQHSLPDVPFTVNYNAKQYNASTKTLLKTEGQLADVDAVITAGTPTVHDGYLTIARGTRATISGYQNYFNRTNSSPNLTIISKQKTYGGDCHIFANRSSSSYNWMYRPEKNVLNFHGSSQIAGTTTTTQPVIESVRVDSSRTLKFNNYTDNTTTSVSNFRYGNTNSVATALFAGYSDSTFEYFVGDFYWIYMCQGTLTDEQVQQVIDYNENL